MTTYTNGGTNASAPGTSSAVPIPEDDKPKVKAEAKKAPAKTDSKKATPLSGKKDAGDEVGVQLTITGDPAPNAVWVSGDK
jgi:hypothetical protein